MSQIITRAWGLTPYLSLWQAMREFTESRTEDTPDEIWLVEHPAVFTQGKRVTPEDLIAVGDIPVVQTDRGGQTTYHGPGQLLFYVLLDLRRKKITIRALVQLLEQIVLDYCQEKMITAHRKLDAPGVYLSHKKLASIGLAIKRGCSYHGLSVNICMDLSPFRRIYPCGYPDLEVTQLSETSSIEGVAFPVLWAQSSDRLVYYFTKRWEEFHD